MEDDKIKSFFRDMKIADEHRAIPPFPERKEPRKLWPVFLYAAAAAIVGILITVRYVAPPPAGQAVSTLEIDLVVGPDPLKSHSLLESDDQDLSAWESPTGFLSEDY